MHEIMLATQEDVPQLLGLYCKALRAAAMDTVPCSEGKRDDFIKWLAERCESQHFWVAREQLNPLPIALMEFDADKNEIISIVVCDEMERKGIATFMIKKFQEREASLRAIPVSRGGKALLRKCNFIDAGNHWIWRRS